jgi:acetyltransferase-like isoleucine patch superfamily enzyme
MLGSYSEKRKNVGKFSYIDPSVQVIGWKAVKIGSHSVIGEDTWINVNHRDAGRIAVDIGDYCQVGRRNFFTSGDLIKLGDYCLIGVDCQFLGAGHVYASPFIPYVFAEVSTGGTIEIGPNCWLGSGVTVLKGVKIGFGSIIGAATLVTHDIPPLSIAIGNPCKVIRRYDIIAERWMDAREYGDRGLMLPSEEEYLETLKRNCPSLQLPLHASSKLFGDL